MANLFKKNLVLSVIISIIFVTDIFSLTGSNLQRIISNSGIYFIENKGQIIDQVNNLNQTVLYLLNTPGFTVQLRKGGFSYDVYSIRQEGEAQGSELRAKDSASQIPYPISSIQDPATPRLDLRGVYPESSGASTSSMHFHRIDFDLIGYNPNCEILTSEPSSDYLNYYTTGTPVEGVTFVRSYQSVTYKDIYPDVDLEFLGDEEHGFKYNFVIYPGGRVEDIRIHITGSEIELTPNGSLLLKTTIGTIEENIPNSYLLCNDKIDVKIKFQKLSEDIYGFSSVSNSGYDSTLIIDPVPTRLWGTYFGGDDFFNYQEEIFSICLDNNGKIIIAGETSSANNIATSGAHQATISFPPDAFLSKFTSDGVQIWGTYYGGGGGESGHACITDKDGNIYLYGITFSTNYISTPGAWQTNFAGGNFDMFIAKFNPNGIRQWGTYFGGSGDEVMELNYNIVSMDTNDNLYVTGKTNSVNMASPGALQDTLGGLTDAFLAKFNSNGKRLWCTYYGGEGDDGGFCTSIDNNGLLYFSGYSNSTIGIATPGAHQITFGGGPFGDAFLASFDTVGQLQWCTYYGGSNDDEGCACVATNSHMVYLVGATWSQDNISSPGSYQTNLANNTADAFIAKFNDNGTRQWGTYYGGESNDWAYTGSYDPRGSIFFGGITFSYQDIATPNSWQPVKQIGGSDAFLIKFDTLGQRIWGTYYGGPGTDYGRAITTDTNDRQYLAGMTSSLTGIATPNSHQPNHSPGGPWDGFFVKLTDCENPIPGQISGPIDVCINSTNINYSIPPIPKVISYVWSVPSGVTLVNGQNTNSITVNIGSVTGTGDISVYATNHCGTGDTVYKTIIINSLPIPTIIGDDTACSGQMLTYYSQPGNSLYQWSISSGGTIYSGGTTSDSLISVVWNSSGNQWISVNYTDTNGCSAATPVQFDVWIIVGPTVNVTISTSDTSVCAGNPVTYTATPINGGTTPVYQWQVNEINTGTDDPLFVYIPVNGDIVTCILTSSITSCISNNPDTSNTITMMVNPYLPVSVSISASANPFCIGNTVTFTATPANAGTTPSYQWKVNGANAGTNSPTYTYSPASGDLVLCILTSSDQCVSGNPATSNTITMAGNTGLPAGVTIVANPNPFCPGSPVTFTATPMNGGFNPAYQWKVNGSNAGTNSTTFTYNPSNNDSVCCVMTSTLNCVSGNPAISNKIILNGTLAPIVTFTACFDTITTLNAKPFKLKGGIPLGGIYSGPGVDQITGYFNPAMAGLGIKTITYSYTNWYNCSDNEVRSITVVSPVPFTCGDSITDIRNNTVYPTVQIGTQCWMATNLNYGTMIPGTTNQRDNCLPEKYCYNDLPELCALSSALYQWDEVMCYSEAEEIQGFCPPGWQVPSEADWNQLFSFYQGNAFAGSPLLYSGYSGFNAQLTGISAFNQSWHFEDFATMYWSSTSHGLWKAWAHGMNEYNFSVSYYPSYRTNALSVRCVKDQ
ncbi:MAG: FISUMP domain-containing protein [Bacteroidota bacterium]